jgi:hypothetical protein
MNIALDDGRRSERRKTATGSSGDRHSGTGMPSIIRLSRSCLGGQVIDTKILTLKRKLSKPSSCLGCSNGH